MWALPEAEGRNDMSKQRTVKLRQYGSNPVAYRVVQTANTTTPKINESLDEAAVKRLIAQTGILSYVVTIVGK